MERTPLEWVTYLARAHEAEIPHLQELSEEYEGRSPLSYMHPEIIRELGDRLKQVIINWPRLVVDSVEERLDVEGFRYSDDETTADDLWAMWQANGMDEQSQQGHVDSIVMKRSFLAVGTNENDAANPLMTVESPLQMHADWDPRTRTVRAALRRWHERDLLTGAVRDQYATLYLPNETIGYSKVGATGWAQSSLDNHRMGVVPVVPIVNRPRLMTPWGTSDLDDILPLAHAASKIATDMMLSAEYHAMPRRYALGFDEEDFTDKDGNKISVWSRLAGRIWATAKNRKDDGVDVGQFPEAELANFHNTLNALARMASSLSGLPPQFLGLNTENPPSADAIRAGEIRLIKRAERKQRALGGSYEQGCRIALRIRDGDWDPRARSLETLWRDPATPTFAQMADAAVKLHVAGIVPTEQTWEDLQYTAEQRNRMRQMRDDAADRVMGGDLAALYGPKPPDPNEPDPGAPPADPEPAAA